jgi:flagellar motor switch protein FliM
MDPKDIISDEESQALRTNAPALDATGPAGARPAGQIQDLHADHWERILADRAPALESIAERMVSLLKTTGRRFFRTSLDVIAQPIRPVRWGAYARALPAPTSLNVIEIRPANLKGLIALNAEFVFALVDVFFGGDGKGKRSEDLLDFTPMEHRLTRKFIEAVAGDLKQAWKPFLDVDFTPGKTETNPIFTGIAGSSETLSVAGFSFVIGECEHSFEIVLPAAIVEPLRSLHDTGQAEAAGDSAQKWRSRLREDVQGARVSMRAVLSATEINLRDIALARPGDVIPTELPANVVLFAGDQPLLEGTFGIFQGRNAVRISKPVNTLALGERHGRAKDN